LLGLSHFFLNQLDAARLAFVQLLSLDPDYQLDPLYVPPQAIAFLDTVRRNNQDLLDPIRERRKATLEAAAQEEAARKRFLTLGAGAAPRTIRERVEKPSVWLALVPFGAGQFQNDDLGLGLTFLLTEAATLATSIGCYAWVEGLRGSDGFYSASNYQTALAARTTQIVAGGVFLGLVVGGATQALIARKPPHVIIEEDNAPARPAPPKVGAGFAPVPGGGVGSFQVSF